ncbi:hypothetical protein BLOT_016867 [Blomia tropicalis]|nr:hypothetical protein BLOT_016867 [Blomia tropicalis]
MKPEVRKAHENKLFELQGKATSSKDPKKAAAAPPKHQPGKSGQKVQRLYKPGSRVGAIIM